jgi:hypothetical protein
MADAGSARRQTRNSVALLSRAECLRCHNAWAGDTLSFNWFQLNPPVRKASASSEDDNASKNSSELQRLADLGVLRVKSAKLSAPLANPYDSSLDLAERARSWLHVNCAPCHRNGAGGDVPSWFNYDQRIESSRAYDGKPARGDFGILGARVIAPGDPYRSTLFYRINTEGLGRMPHIGSRFVDEAGVRLLRDWIRSVQARASDDSDGRRRAKARGRKRDAVRRNHERKTRRPLTKLLANTSGCLALLDYVTSGAAGVTNPATLRRNLKKIRASSRRLLRWMRRNGCGLKWRPPRRRTQTRSCAICSNDCFRRISAAKRLVRISTRRRCSHFKAALCAARKFFSAQRSAHVATCAMVLVVLTDQTSRKSEPSIRVRSCWNRFFIRPRLSAPEYKLVRVELRNETELSGFVLKRTGTELVLRDETLTEHTVKLADVKESRESALSAMPEGLLAPLTAQEAADLLEYLSAKRN